MGLSSCVSTGPKISAKEIAQKQIEFDRKFYASLQTWLPRIYRIGYRLLKAPVPQHSSETPKYNFLGVGVQEIKKPTRKALDLPKKVRGVLVIGLYPGSEAEGLPLKMGDVIKRVNGKRVKTLAEFYKQIKKAKGDSVTLNVWAPETGSSVLQAPLEKVYYNAIFFLKPTPNFHASALFSKIEIGIGAIRYARNDDELAVIMGHELAHTTLKHTAKKLGSNLGVGVAYSAVVTVVDTFTVQGLGNILVDPVKKITDSGISRRYEREADYYGMKHAFHADYAIENGARVFARLSGDKPTFNILSYTFASHPSSPERFLKLEKIIEEFREQYPERFPMTHHSDWQVAIPLQPGESIYEAILRLAEEIKDKEPETETPVEAQVLEPVPRKKKGVNDRL